MWEIIELESFLCESGGFDDFNANLLRDASVNLRIMQLISISNRFRYNSSLFGGKRTKILIEKNVYCTFKIFYIYIYVFL